MRVRKWIAVALITMCALTARPQARSSADKPVESEHHPGPNGLETWTLNWPIPDDPNQERYPVTLVIARHGKIVRKIEGDSFVWKWIFLEDGRKVAYETGPMHWEMWCKLADVETGRVIHSIDCFHELPKTAPAWAKALEAAP
jgi:hypothetical protein